jgi:hypothetical protein
MIQQLTSKLDEATADLENNQKLLKDVHNKVLDSEFTTVFVSKVK